MKSCFSSVWVTLSIGVYRLSDWSKSSIFRQITLLLFGDEKSQRCQSDQSDHFFHSAVHPKVTYKTYNYFTEKKTDFGMNHTRERNQHKKEYY